jgi:hypothetical protein
MHQPPLSNSVLLANTFAHTALLLTHTHTGGFSPGRNYSLSFFCGHSLLLLTKNPQPILQRTGSVGLDICDDDSSVLMVKE